MRDDLRDANLEVTRNLIAWDHEEISIARPPKKVRQPDGSVKAESSGPTYVHPQRLFFSGITTDDIRSVTVNGELVESRHVLVGMPDADFEEGDTFFCWGRKFLVAEVHPDTRWQRKAWVVERGK